MSLQPMESLICLQCSQCARVPVDFTAVGQRLRCPRCGAIVHRRKQNTLSRTWALLTAAAILYVPANFYPFLNLDLLGRNQPDTIFAGIVQLFGSGMWGVALIIFFASIAVPLLKIVGLSFLLFSVQLHSQKKPLLRCEIFRFIENIGPWSMIDVFVVSLMIALVSFGQLATIEPGPGATCFAAVVVLTLFAAKSFDPRVIWDELESDS